MIMMFEFLEPRTEKVLLLFNELENYYGVPNFSGIIFVKRRLTTTILSQIIGRHPKLKEYFKVTEWELLKNI